MPDLFWLSDVQMARLEPFFPKSCDTPRIDVRRVLTGIVFINRNGLRWRNADAGVLARASRSLQAQLSESAGVLRVA